MKVLLLLCAIEMCFFVSASAPEGGMTQAYLLRGPHRLDLRETVKCTAVTSVILHEEEFIKELGKDTLVAQVKPSTNMLELTLGKDGLMVRAGDKTADKYKVTKDSELFLGAMFTSRRVAVVNSVLIDKEKGSEGPTTRRRGLKNTLSC